MLTTRSFLLRPAVAVALALGGLAPTAALAAPPGVVQGPPDFVYSSEICGFTVGVVQSGSDATYRSFATGRETILAAADTILTLTGPTGRQAVIRSSGPSFLDLSSARIVLTGWTFLEGIPGRPPGFYSGTGRTVIDLVSGGLTATGHFVDVCPLVAPV